VLEAVGAGLLQGVAVVFPISGLGHAVLAGALGNNAGADLAPANAGYLYACLRLGIGVALLAYFWRDWARVARGIGSTFRRSARPGPRRWAWLVVLAALPACIAVAILDPYVRPLSHHPRLAAGCLAGNGLLMLLVWWWWRRSPRAGGMSGVHRARLSRAEEAETFGVELSVLPAGRVLMLGLLPIASLVPGVSGVGLVVATGLVWGLTHEQAARAALLLVTPVFLTWGGRDLPDLGAAQYSGVRTAVVVAGVVAFVAAYLTAALLVRYFRSASLRPFGYYCVLAGGAALYSLAR
jgi:undecaprenyl-diphosphatase